ncbi:MAG: hypothetical protein ABSG86_28895 [Thermoguttaceae bacterium]|jgi:hypothetical protein
MLCAAPPRSGRWLAVVAAGWIWTAGLPAAAAAPPAPAEDLYRAAQTLKAKYAAELAKLASWCDEHALAAEAKTTRQALDPQDPYKLYFPLLPSAVGPPGPPAGAGGETLQWHARFLKLRQEQADALYDVARQAVRKRQASLAYQLVLEAIRENPDHEAARRVFGYQNYEGQWRTAYEVRKLRAGMVWHQKFGWLPQANVARYEQGERLSGGRWVSQEADARAHRTIQTGWDVETDHYLIRTNHSIEAGVDLGLRLERLHRLWQQMFVCFYASDAPADTLLSGRAQARFTELPRFHVSYFRNRQEYLHALVAKTPDIAVSSGLYRASDRVAYFYAGGDDTERVLYHEATHQLFQQSRRAAPDVGARTNFWIVEGVAMYMESLHRENSSCVLGGLNDPRMVAARYHLLKEDFYVPFAQVTALGMRDLQTHSGIKKLYSQIAAMTHLLICADGGRYRDALVAYLSAVYNGSQDPHLLARLTGLSYADLDRKYRAFIETAQPDKPPSE